MKSIMGRLVDRAAFCKRAIAVKPSGFGRPQPARKMTGYHKQMKPADLKWLAYRLQRDAVK